MNRKQVLSFILALSMTATSSGTFPVFAEGENVELTPSKQSGNMTITLKIKKSITPSVKLSDWQYGSEPNKPEVEGNSGNGKVTYEYKVKDADDSTYTTAVPNKTGDYTVRATIVETDEYKSGTAEADFSITPFKTGITIKLKIKNRIDPVVKIEDWQYGSKANVPEVEGNTGDAEVTFEYKPADAKDSEYTKAIPTAEGAYTVRAKVAETEEYYGGAATADFNITPLKTGMTISLLIKETPDLKVSLDDWNFGDTAKTPTVTGNGGKGTVTYTYYKGEEKLEKVPTAVGTYTVKASVPETDTHKAAEATADFTIGKASLTPSVTLAGWAFGDTANDPEVKGNTGNGTVKFEYKVKGAEDSTYSETVPTAVGTYVVKASVGETANYKAGTATVEFTIGHGHSYAEKWSYDESKHWHECTSAEGECDAQKTDVAEHTFTEWKVTKEATCEEAGTESRKCTVCGKEEIRPVAATGHKYGTPVYTWSEDGKSCTATAICETDNKFTVTETVEVTSAVKTPATCEKAGVTTYTAKFKNELFSAQTKDVEDIPATGHKYGTPVYTWSEEGKSCTATAVCETDKKFTVTETVEVTSAVKAPATCDKSGVTTYTAKFENELFSAQTKEIENIPATGHKFGEWTVAKEATDESDGYKTRKCEHCDKEETEVILATGHEFGDWTVTKAATCEENGIETRYCTHDDGTFETRDIPAIGHKYGTPVYTWSADGKTCTATVTCEHDKAHVITEEAVLTSAVKVAATCDKAGVTTYTATFKNELFSVQTKEIEDIPAAGHEFGDWVVSKPTTCEEKGIETRYCTHDDGTFETREIPAIGHKYGTPVYTWSEDGKTCTATVTCENDKTHVVTEKVNAAGVVTTSATCDKAGVTTYTAQFENELFSKQTKELEDIPATGHKFGAWHITITAGADHDGEKVRACEHEGCNATETLPTKYDDDNTTDPSVPSDPNEPAPGKIENITDPKGNACGGSIDVTKKDILETFPLTREECEQVENGSDISLKLEVSDATEETSEDDINKAIAEAVDKAAAELAKTGVNADKEAMLNNAVVAAVLDVTIEKYIDGEDAGRVKELNKPLRVYIDIPEGLYQDNRTFYIVREHDGVYEALELKFVNPTRAYFESDKYSQFFIVYTEKAEVVEPVHEHEFGEWTTSQNASWTRNGIETRTCECGETETRVVEENWTSWLISAVGRRLRNLFR